MNQDLLHVAAARHIRLKHINPGVVVGKADELTHIDIEVIAHQRKLIGESDIHITKAVLGELPNSAVRAVVASSSPWQRWHKRIAARSSGGEATYHAVVTDQLLEDAAQSTRSGRRRCEACRGSDRSFRQSPEPPFQWCQRRGGFKLVPGRSTAQWHAPLQAKSILGWGCRRPSLKELAHDEEHQPGQV